MALPGHRTPPEPTDRIAGQPLAGRLRSPLHPIAPFWRIKGYRAPEPTRTVWPLHHQSVARSCSPDTPMRTSSRPLHGDDFIETKKGSFRAPLPMDPSHRPKGRVTPLGTPTNEALVSWRTAALELEHMKGLIRSLNPDRGLWHRPRSNLVDIVVKIPCIRDQRAVIVDRPISAFLPFQKALHEDFSYRHSEFP